MTEQLISFETAKLAKEKGFDPNNELYRFEDHFEDKVFLNIFGIFPTQSILQKWIRETHNIHVFIGRRPNVKKWDSHAYSLFLSGKEYVKERTMEKFRQEPLFDTYEEALEHGLQEALKLI